MKTNYCEKAYFHTMLHIDTRHLTCAKKSPCAGRAIAFFALPIRLTLHTVFHIAIAIESLVNCIISLITSCRDKNYLINTYEHLKQLLHNPSQLILFFLFELISATESIFSNINLSLKHRMKALSRCWLYAHSYHVEWIKSECRYMIYEVVYELYDNEPIAKLSKKFSKLFLITKKSCSKDIHPVEDDCILAYRYNFITSLPKCIRTLPGVDPKRKEKIAKLFERFVKTLDTKTHNNRDQNS